MDSAIEETGLPSRQRPIQKACKRGFDFIVAVGGLIVLAPVLIVIALLVRFCIGRPVLFSQERPGMGGEIFRIFKFRTMSDARDEKGRLLPDVNRLTRLGRGLRSTSLDELPELWNIIRGEMSFVGPRPLLPEYLKHYTPEEARRHEVRPGITGWAQINGRNTLSWEEKFRLDVWYVDNWNLRLDAKILAKTVWSVLKREGISAAGHATMPVFSRVANPAGDNDSPAQNGRRTGSEWIDRTKSEQRHA